MWFVVVALVIIVLWWVYRTYVSNVAYQLVPSQAGWSQYNRDHLRGYTGTTFNTSNTSNAGDAKFAAAMAPFFMVADVRYALGLFAACLLAAFAIHRIARRIPALKPLTTTWVSWTNKDFPMGLALSGTLIFYLATPLWMYVRAG